MKFFFESILYSYSQIFFCNRRWFGIVALLSTFIIPTAGALALGGVIFSNMIALSLKFDKEKIRSGFYGFNGILFGAAISFYFQITPFIIMLMILFIVLTFFLAAVMENYLAIAFNLPGLSLPFIFSLYIFLIFITNYDDISVKQMLFKDTNVLNFLPAAIITYFKSFSLILFQSSVLSGIVLSIALLFFSRVMFVNSIIAFAANYFLVHIIFKSPSDIVLILTSFNSILAAIALGGSLIILSKKSFFLIILSSIFIIILTGFFVKFMSGFYLPVLVLPFNFVVLATLYSLKFRQEQSDLVLLYFKPGSPEENYYYHKNRQSRFNKFKKVFPELPFFGEWFISQGINGGITHKEDWKDAWDFVIVEDNKSEYSNDGSSIKDYYCYNTPVVAPLDGKVVRTFDNIDDNEIGEVNLNKNWGNTIIIEHTDGLYSSLSHLVPGSIKVKIGEDVKKGQVLAKCGNSGRSPHPHLHFQFQQTDKLGDKTLSFPIAHFYEKLNGKYHLKTFDFPNEKGLVRNIEPHETLTKAFKFQLGDEFNINYTLNGKTQTESWEVKVDILNNMYIESNNKSVAFIYPQDKVFYMANFVGNKKCALYFFYILSISVPLGYIENLTWEDNYPIAITTKNIVRYISEFFLLIAQMVTSKSNLKFKPLIDDEDKFVVETSLLNKGFGLFKFYKEEGNGQIIIDREGRINEFFFNMGKKRFAAKIEKLTEE